MLCIGLKTLNPSGTVNRSCKQTSFESGVFSAEQLVYKLLQGVNFTMTEKSKTKSRLRKEEETEKRSDELESIIVLYNGKDHTVKFPNNADARVICQSIKRETGVKGSFYVHFGEKSNNYLHCSSVTRGNLAKLSGRSLEVRGGNAFNKGGDPIWYYNSQSLKPAVQEEFKEMQVIPLDNPP